MMTAWFLGATVPFGVTAIGMGVAAFRTGWMITPARRSVRQPRVYGVGLALAGLGLLTAVATYFSLPSDVVSRDPWLAFVGNFLELTGVALIASSRRSPRHGRAPHPTV
ncbi:MULTISPECIES: hypothetical protein [Streptomyces]|jgi:hypothetical protein|uniref:Uncharacterized protein n=1 Tax=Streptomyces nymphaeiformis TaxID=2663842 RepID=A0A7W7U6T1_9ACTN|nr:hypothetical protein [Streptomyces nymphaeiformis]MBB4986138.1 hypothetical protein [Streptomyces nymphaeiformis]